MFSAFKLIRTVPKSALARSEGDRVSRLLLSAADIEHFQAYDDGRLYRKYVRHFTNELFLFQNSIGFESFDCLFMPPAGFPQVHGRIIEAGAGYTSARSRLPRAAFAFRIDFFLLPDVPAAFGIELGPVRLSVRADREQCDVALADESLGKFPGRHLSVSVRLVARRWMLAVNAARVTGIDHLLSRKASLPRFRLTVEHGRIAIIQYQYLAEDDAHFADYSSGATPGTVVLAASSPAFVRLWENRSRSLYHLALAATVLHRASVSGEAQGVWARVPDLQAALAGLMTQALGALAAWPHWRPTAANGVDWERGNWSNGFLIAAAGVLTCALEHNLSEAQRRQITVAVDEKGVGWLVGSAPKRPGRLLHRSFSLVGRPCAALPRAPFPPPAHWIKRSTNHGLVILATAWIGTALLFGPDDARARELLCRYRAVLEPSFAEGSYLEGIWYAEFVLLESMLLFWLRARQKGQPFPEHVLAAAPFLLEVKNFFARACGADGTKIAAFGDCPRLRWVNAVNRLLRALPGGADFRRRGFAANMHELDRFSPANHASAFAPFAALLSPAACTTPPGGPGQSFPPAGIKLYRGAHIAHVVARGPEGNTSEVWLFGSTLHLTHNKNHDALSFLVVRNGRLVLDRGHGKDLRPAWMHNTIGLKSAALVPGGGPYDAFGRVSDDGRPLPRKVSGRIEDVQEAGDFYLVSGTARGEVIHDPRAGAGIREFSRAVLVSRSGDLVLLVDFVRFFGRHNPIASFHPVPEIRPGSADTTGRGRVVLEGGAALEFLAGFAAPAWGACPGSIQRIEEPGGKSRIVQEFELGTDVDDQDACLFRPTAVLFDPNLQVQVALVQGRSRHRLIFTDNRDRRCTIEITRQLAISYHRSRFNFHGASYSKMKT